MDRKTFLKLSATTVAGASMLPGCGLFDEPEMLIDSVEQLEQSAFTITKFNRKKIMVTKLDGEWVIFSLICRHKKCTVAYEAEIEEFACPCHEGRYDKLGRVLDGPPPGPLRRFKWEIRAGKLWVLNEFA
ncbi:MAG: Rieske 2Fe-2S domain-containing protein [Bacteroidota bacterium]